VIGNNEWTNKVLEKAGYKILRVGHYKRFLYEGWRIRRLIRSSLSSRVPPLAGSRDLIWQKRVPEYIKYQISNIKNTYQKSNIFNNVVLGGTFDHFHKGHKALLKKAFDIGKKVTIGISTEKLYKDKFLSETIEPFKIRKKSIKKYIRNYLMDGRIGDIISLSDFSGGADKIKKYDAIIVSKSTYPNALKINQLREKNELPLLRIVIVDDVLADDGKLISSDRIRLGEIDRNGRCYELGAKWREKKQLVMPENLREELRKPLGRVFKSTKELLQCFKTLKWTMVVAVGDIIVDALMKNGIGPEVKIIDFKTRRKQNDLNRYHLVTAAQELYINKPGTINLKTAEKLKELIHQQLGHPKGVQPQSWLVIDGEEDLLALPAILFSPLGSLVFYGHWQLGVIGVEVTEEMKEKASQIVKKFR